MTIGNITVSVAIIHKISNSNIKVFLESFYIHKAMQNNIACQTRTRSAEALFIRYHVNHRAVVFGVNPHRKCYPREAL